jgi:hypothetical protein
MFGWPHEPDNRLAVSQDLLLLIDDIRSLLDSPARGDGAPRLERLEETLTSGYARALALEAETLRLKRRLGELASTIARQSSPELADELTDVAHRLAASEGQIRILRELLSSLRHRVAGLRAAAAVA